MKDEEPHSLANVTFRWMLQEIHRSQCGILFDDHSLRDLGIPADCIPSPSTEEYPAAPDLQSVSPVSAVATDIKSPACTSNLHPPLSQENEGSTSAGIVSSWRKLQRKAKILVSRDNAQRKETLPEQSSKLCADLDAIDVLEPTHDQLKANPLWWLLQSPIWWPGEILCVSLPRITRCVPYLLAF